MTIKKAETDGVPLQTLSDGAIEELEHIARTQDWEQVKQMAVDQLQTRQ